eukprot:1160601-Pelagomonas_calceolata.AAC.1
MPKDRNPEWDYVTVAEPDEAEGESKAKNVICKLCNHLCNLCYRTDNTSSRRNNVFKGCGMTANSRKNNYFWGCGKARNSG